MRIEKSRRCFGLRFFVSVFLMFCVIVFPLVSAAQPVGATINNPIVMGSYGGGTFNYSDTKNNNTANGYQNNYGQSSDDIYYQFTVQGSTQITISHCGSGFDTYMHLLNSGGGLITSNDDNGPVCSGLTASISTTLAAGTYYIVVEGYGGNSGNIITAVTLVVQGSSTACTVQPPSNTVGANDYNINWIKTKAFDENGNIITEAKAFFDSEGKATQSQSKRKVVIAGTTYTHVFASQVINDELGRPAMNTLSAPINYSDFKYQANFISKNGLPYTYKNYDRFHNGSSYDNSKINNPDVPDNTGIGTLGWYYSNNNSWEPYTATTGYPFTRSTFYGDGSGSVKKSAGAGEAFRMGSGRELMSFTTPVINELDHYVQVRNKYFTVAELGELPASYKYLGMQSGGNDANGREAVSIADKEGKVLMVARPGSDLSIQNTVTLAPAYRYSFQANAMNYTRMLKLSGSGNAKVWLGTSAAPYGTLLYSGVASNFNLGSTNLIGYFTIESTDMFTVSYWYVEDYSYEYISVVNSPADAVGSNAHYFKLFTPSQVSAGSGFALYDMSTEQQIGFSSGSTLGAGYYKVINAGSTDPITVSYSNSYTDISYNFYNQIGQLVATIAPEGVKKLLGSGINNYATKTDVPFISTIEYDVQGRLVKSTNPDAGYGEMVYRKDGKIRFSQNAEQRTDGRYSYINYDSYGRLVEAGEYKPLGGGIAFNADMSAGTNPMRDILEDVSSTGGLINGTKSFVTKTTYDLEDYNFKNASLRPELEGYVQSFVRGGVSASEKLDDGITTTSKTWFSYDEQGRVNWVIKYINGLGYKTTDNTYDALGKLIKDVYQKGTPSETFVHYYEYNANHEVAKVYTNTVDNSSTKTLQASYEYYMHGGLKRTVLGDNVQGLDYTYTLQGALKAINNSDKPKDPGGDGSNGVLGDAFGMVLDYYANDYVNGRTCVQPINGVNTSGIATDSYVGQIKAMSWFSEKPPASGVSNAPTTYVYKYDDKYQFTESVWGTGLNFSNTPATFTQSSANKESVYNPGTSTPAYDANGNIRFLQRTNGGGAYTDKFTYNYLNTLNGTGSNTSYNSNKLQSVVHDNNGTPQTYASYQYDNLGQLKTESAGIGSTTKYIKYDVAGKVICVARDAGFTQKVVEYVYDETGIRIIKRSYNSSFQLAQTTYYAGDVIYTQAPGGNPVAQEYEITGAGGRIGVYFRQANIYAYQLTDHLGNTRAVVAKSGSSLDVRSYSDYYPYGMVIREYKASEGYRYGYQGQYSEKDGETDWNSFELRMYDSRIARWMQYDPKGEFWSPYVGMGNNPVALTDPDGGSVNGPNSDFLNAETGATLHIEDGINKTFILNNETFQRVSELSRTNTWANSDWYKSIVQSNNFALEWKSDLGNLIKIVYAEMGRIGTTEADRQIVAEAVMNRYYQQKGKSITEIIEAKNQFQATSTTTYKDGPYAYIEGLEKNSPEYYRNNKGTLYSIFLSIVSMSYKTINGINTPIGHGVVSYVSKPLGKDFFDKSKSLQNVTDSIQGLKWVTGVWKTK